MHLIYKSHSGNIHGQQIDYHNTHDYVLGLRGDRWYATTGPY